MFAIAGLDIGAIGNKLYSVSVISATEFYLLLIVLYLLVLLRLLEKTEIIYDFAHRPRSFSNDIYIAKIIALSK